MKLGVQWFEDEDWMAAHPMRDLLMARVTRALVAEAEKARCSIVWPSLVTMQCEDLPGVPCPGAYRATGLMVPA